MAADALRPFGSGKGGIPATHYDPRAGEAVVKALAWVASGGTLPPGRVMPGGRYVPFVGVKPLDQGMSLAR